MMAFLYPFLNYLQPGILWPELAEYRPMIWVSALCLLVGLRAHSVYPRSMVYKHPATISLFVMWFAQGLSMYYAGLHDMIEEFDYWSVHLFFVLVSILLICDLARLRSYVWGAMAGGAFIIGYGIYARYNNLQVDEVLVQLGMAGAYGMYENHNDYSFIVVQAFPYFVLFLRETKGFIKRLLLMASTFASLWGIMLSLSRGGAIAIAIEVAMLLGILTKGAKRAVILAVFSVVALAAIQFQFSTRAERQGANYTEADSENSREELWRAGWQMFLAHPIIGVGSRRFAEFATQYGELSHDNVGKNAHNTYFEIMATTGLLGIGGLLMMITYLVRDLRKKPPSGTPSILETTQKATLISLLAIVFRAFFDSKVFDLSFFFLCVVGVTTCVLIRVTSPTPAGSESTGSAKRPLRPPLPRQLPRHS